MGERRVVITGLGVVTSLGETADAMWDKVWAAGEVSIRFGIRGPNTGVATACATGSNSIGDAMRFIQHDMADVMIAGGSEAALCELGMASFMAARALSSRNDDPQRGSRPWDK